MSLRFVVGPAGSGKTYHCLQAIGEELQRQPLGPPLLFLLPEQATFIHERMLAEMLPKGVYSRASVTSLERLALSARSFPGGGAAPLPPLSGSGRRLLAAAALARFQPQLQIFAAAAARAGFAAQVADMVEELSAWQVEPEQLEAAAEACGPEEQPAARRWRELALLYRACQEQAEGRYGSRRQELAYLSQAFAAGWQQQATVYVDGYASFTACERQALLTLAANCRQMEIMLALDPEQGQPAEKETNLFGAVWQEYQLLTDGARQRGISVLPPLRLSRGQGRYAQAPALDAVERALAGLDTPPQTSPPTAVALFPASTRRAEVERACREIVRLTREQGFRYRDISVIVRDLAPYRQLLPQVFDRFQLPFFTDSSRSLQSQPLIELVRAILAAWVYRPERQRLFRYLKNPLSGLSPQDCDCLENYSLAHGLRWWHWQGGPWSFHLLDEEPPELPEKMENLRQQGVAPLLSFLAELGVKTDAKRFNVGLRVLLQRLQAEAKLQAMADQAARAGDGALAEWHRQAWPRLNALLDEAQRLLGEMEYPAAQLSELYEAALAGLTLSTIPPGLDQVFVCSMERSRNPEIRAAFVLGVNEGAFPRRAGNEGLLGTGERQLLAQLGLTLGPDRRQRQVMEDYLAYVGLTRSHEKLWVSWPRWEVDGTQLAPSPLIQRLQALFPAIPLRPEVIGPRLLTGSAGDLDLAAVSLRRSGPAAALATQVQDWFSRQWRFRPQYRGVAAGLAYAPRRAPLARASLERLYGHVLKSSVSRLERYRQCPLAYFADYGLKLRPRREFQLRAADRGELCHRLLATIGRRMQAEKRSWAEIGPHQAEQLVDEALAAEEDFLGGFLHSSRRNEYLRRRIRSMLLRAVLIWAEQIRRGSFQPVSFELGFGDGELLPALVLKLDGRRQVRLSGRIDRVDMAYSGDRKRIYLRVVDYKTGQVSLKRDDVAAGIRAQLLVYLQVVLDGAKPGPEQTVYPAGAFYSYLRDDLTLVAANPETQEGEAPPPPRGLQFGGLAVADEEAVELADPQCTAYSQVLPIARRRDNCFRRVPYAPGPSELEALMEQMFDSLRQSAMALLDGDISAAPLLNQGRLACANCDYHALCGFAREQAQAQAQEQE